MVSFSATRLGISASSESRISFPPTWSVKQYTAQNGARHDVRDLVVLPGYAGFLSVLQNSHAEIPQRIFEVKRGVIEKAVTGVNSVQ